MLRLKCRSLRHSDWRFGGDDAAGNVHAPRATETCGQRTHCGYAVGHEDPPRVTA